MEIVFRIEIEGVGDKIKNLRNQSPKSVTRLAADSDISVAQWYKIEKEEVPVKFETLQDIAQALETPLSAFINQDVSLVVQD